ncbi:hypothetical protein DL767_009852 [Monosporascus sp. MG133]|nr:hypothetical protein DL767_009852 [Monosporascus sp. MG133]
MRLINVKTSKFEEFPEHRAPSYAILSHTWGSDVEELTFRDVEKGITEKPGVGRLVFYGSKWHRLGAKAQLRTVIEEVTGIPKRFLTGGVNIESASVAQRMSWAALRQTTRKEDLAYCLLGLFGIAMPMIYGEGGDRAFFRLQEQIMRSTRDHSILAWGLGESTSDSAQSQAGGFLATSPFDFAYSGDIVPRDQRAAYLDLLEISGGSLRVSLSLFTVSTETIGLLNCGPEGNAQQLIYVKNDIGPDTRISDQQGWAYDDGDFADVNLELVDVVPRSSWHEGRSIIIPTTESDGSTVSPTLVRLRHEEEGSRDFILILELKQQDTHVKVHHCVAICSRDTPSEELAGRLPYIIQAVAGRKIASNGLLNLQLVLEPSAGQSMFTIRPETVLHLPDVTVDATIKLPLEEPVDANATWQLRRTLEGHKDWVGPVAFSHNSKLLASGSNDSTVRLWNPATGQLRRTLEGHIHYVRSVAFSYDSKLLASGSDDSTVRLWEQAVNA